MDEIDDGHSPTTHNASNSRRINVQKFLKLVPLFSGLDKSQIELLASQTGTRTLQKRECLFVKGGVPRYMYVVISGQVKVFIPTPEGREKVVTVFGPMQVISDASLFHDDNYLTNAEAIENCLIYCIPKNAVMGLIQSNVRFAEGFINELSLKVKLLINELGTCSLKSSVQRVIDYLFRCLPKKHKKPTAMITLPTAKQVIASQLSLTPETLSRILRDLADADLIKVDGKSIFINDIDKLSVYVSAS